MIFGETAKALQEAQDKMEEINGKEVSPAEVMHLVLKNQNAIMQALKVLCSEKAEKYKEKG